MRCELKYYMVTDAQTADTWAEGQKVDAIRKAYQHAVQTPMDGVEHLWKEYQEFENRLNRITVRSVLRATNGSLLAFQAKKFISDLAPAHMQARTVLTTLQEHLTGLFPPPSPYKYKTKIQLPRQHDFSTSDKAFVSRWRLYVKWEGGNPLDIKNEHKAQLHSRLQSVYRKAIVRMRFFPEIWYVCPCVSEVHWLACLPYHVGT